MRGLVTGPPGGHWASVLLLAEPLHSGAPLADLRRLRAHWAAAGARRTPEARGSLSLDETRGLELALAWVWKDNFIFFWILTFSFFYLYPGLDVSQVKI